MVFTYDQAQQRKRYEAIVMETIKKEWKGKVKKKKALGNYETTVIVNIHKFESPKWWEGGGRKKYLKKQQLKISKFNENYKCKSKKLDKS